MSTAFAPKPPSSPTAGTGSSRAHLDAHPGVHPGANPGVPATEPVPGPAAQDYLARLDQAVDSLTDADDSPTPVPANLSKAADSAATSASSHATIARPPAIARPSSSGANNPIVGLPHPSPASASTATAKVSPPVAKPPWAQGSPAAAAPSPSLFVAPAHDEPVLELDLPKPPPKSQNVAAANVPMPRGVRSGDRRGLFARDIWANSAWGLAIGMTLALFVARPAAQRAREAFVGPVVSDIEEAVEHPLSAHAGAIKRPQQLLLDLDAAQARVSARFWRIWAIVGVACALPLVLIRRPVRST